MNERLQRALAVVRAGARIADASDPLGIEARARLPEVTGLSAASVEIALTEHLETRPSSAELSSLLARAGVASTCHVILSANVCTAPLRAIAIACATAPRVLAKPSRRDPVVAELVARALAEDADFAAAGGSIAIVSEVRPASGDELHVYGSDETIERVRVALPAGVILRAHGTGFGVALIDEDARIEDAAPLLARDVAAFDQRGCLSPRVAIVIGDVDRARAFARALARDLAAWQARAPRGALHEDEAAELRRYVEIATALGVAIEGDGFVVGVDESPSALVLPPSARAVHVVPAAPRDVARLLADVAPKIAAIGSALSRGPTESSSPGTQIARSVVPGARFSPLGSMQRPPLDGPVDLRAAPSVMERPPPIANEESDLGGADFAKRRPGVGT